MYGGTILDLPVLVNLDKNCGGYGLGSAGVRIIIGVGPRGVFIAVECKIDANKLSEVQQLFLEDISRLGGFAVCVWDVDTLEFAYNNFF